MSAQLSGRSWHGAEHRQGLHRLHRGGAACQNPFMSVHAYLDDQHAAMGASLMKGAKVAWVCKGGVRIVGRPILTGCRPRV